MTDVDILGAAESAAAQFFASCQACRADMADSDEAASTAFWSLRAPHPKQLLFRYHFAITLRKIYQAHVDVPPELSTTIA